MKFLPLMLLMFMQGSAATPAQQSAPQPLLLESLVPKQATIVTAEEFAAGLKYSAEKKVTDMNIVVTDAGAFNMAIGRGGVIRKGSSTTAHFHDRVTEVYLITGGAGTVETGGTLINPQRRRYRVNSVNGPGVQGDPGSQEGGVLKEVKQGDLVILPAGAVHRWNKVTEDLTYIFIRVDPERWIKTCTWGQASCAPAVRDPF